MYIAFVLLLSTLYILSFANVMLQPNTGNEENTRLIEIMRGSSKPTLKMALGNMFQKRCS